jgi:glycosyltransferase involved in cell wall biosynthesis
MSLGAASAKFVSVIVPCRNEERFITQCLESIFTGDYPEEQLEVLVIDGRSDDRTRQLVEEVTLTHPSLRLLDNPSRITPIALNAAIRAARGDVIIRMDAHVRYPPNYISLLVHALETTQADNVGCCIVTLPASDSPMARAIAVGISHPLGVGNSYFRTGTRRPRWVDTVPFGCYRREVFDRIGLFDEELVRNQDDEFNFRLIKNGGRVLLMPDVTAHYYARGSLQALARMYYQYGLFKPLVARKVGRVMTVRQLVPALFVLGLLGSAALAPLYPVALMLLLTICASYLGVLCIGAAMASQARGIRCKLSLVAVFAVLHFSYGLGFLTGMLRVARSRPAADLASIPLSR